MFLRNEKGYATEVNLGNFIRLPYADDNILFIVAEKNNDFIEVVSLDCVGEYYMNNTDTVENGFDGSSLFMWLHNVILYGFSESFIKDWIVSYDDASKIRIPTEKQMFGENRFGLKEDGSVKRFEAMKDVRNRIACSHSSCDKTRDYWLENPYISEEPQFCCVTEDGRLYGDDPSSINGVRIRLRIKNDCKESEVVYVK